MDSPRVLVFVGPVGSGKSTHMRLLYSELKKKGFKVRRSFLKTGHLLAFALEVFLARILTGRRRDVSPIRALIEDKPLIFKRTFKLWLALDLISVTIKFFITIYLPFKLGYTILVEEYIPATISDYMYLSKISWSPLKINSFVIKYLLKLMNLCSPVYAIFLDAENDKLYFRWNFRGGPNEVEDYIRMQRTILLHITKELSNRFIYVDTSSKTPTQAHELLINYIRL